MSHVGSMHAVLLRAGTRTESYSSALVLHVICHLWYATGQLMYAVVQATDYHDHKGDRKAGSETPMPIIALKPNGPKGDQQAAP